MKKDFTLIELLAVIVILAIIALIAVPIVLNIINDSKESSLLRSAEFYLDAVEYTIADAYLYHEGLDDNKYPITPEGDICTKELPCDSEHTLKVDVSGDKPTGGFIEVNDGTITDIEIYLNKRALTIDEEDSFTYIEPKTFSEDSWDVIAANVRAGNISKYKIGDTKEIILTGFTNDEIESDGKYTIRIANLSTPDECSNESFSQTACGFVVEFVDIITTNKMNESDSNIGGWEASKMRSYVNNEILNSLPSDLKELIIETKVISGHGSNEGETNFTSMDKLYLFSTKELWGKDGIDNIVTKDTAEDETRQLDYYKNIGVTSDNYSDVRKTFNGVFSTQWLRTGYVKTSFYTVTKLGSWGCNYASTDGFGVSVAFRL